MPHTRSFRCLAFAEHGCRTRMNSHHGNASTKTPYIKGGTWVVSVGSYLRYPKRSRLRCRSRSSSPLPGGSVIRFDLTGAVADLIGPKASLLRQVWVSQKFGGVRDTWRCRMNRSHTQMSAVKRAFLGGQHCKKAILQRVELGTGSV